VTTRALPPEPDLFGVAVKKWLEERVLVEPVVQALDGLDPLVLGVERRPFQEPEAELRHLPDPDMLGRGVVVGEAHLVQDRRGARQALQAETGLVTNVAHR
jgi:hypothetical protein